MVFVSGPVRLLNLSIYLSFELLLVCICMYTCELIKHEFNCNILREFTKSDKPL